MSTTLVAGAGSVGRVRRVRCPAGRAAAVALAVVGLAAAGLVGPPGAQAAPAVRVTSTVATGLDVPWRIAVLPGSGAGALVSMRDSGVVQLVSNDGHVREVGRVPVTSGGEGGLLGLTLSPHFTTDHLVYAYYSTTRDNRVARMRYTGGRLGAPSVVFAGIPHGGRHNGGGLAFSPGGMLFVSTGDAGDSANAQRVSSLGGKVLRMFPDGRRPTDNPFRGSYVWSLGHRNVQGLAFAADRHLWATEFGENTWDELNVIGKGGNYGWPVVEGRSSNTRYRNPQAVWRTSAGGPSGLAIVHGSAYVGTVTGTRLYRVPLHGTTAGTPVGYLTGTYGRIRAVARSSASGLWISTTNRDGRGTVRSGDDRIVRVHVP